jgi:hypothetical protein
MTAPQPAIENKFNHIFSLNRGSKRLYFHQNAVYSSAAVSLVLIEANSVGIIEIIKL